MLSNCARDGDSNVVMSQRPPERLSEFARRLLHHEAEAAQQADDFAAGFERVCRALNDCLTPLISSPGFHTLFARALKLAARDFPFLAGVSVSTNGDCGLPGLARITETRTSGEVGDALTLALANFIWLLVIFIGENLALRKVREVWPEVPLDSMNRSSGAGR